MPENAPQKVAGFAVFLETVLIVIFLLFDQKVCVYLALLILLLQLFVPSIAEWILHPLHQASRQLGQWMLTLLSGIVFFLLITPVAMLYRLFKRTRNVPQRPTFFVSMKKTYRPDDFRPNTGFSKKSRNL